MFELLASNLAPIMFLSLIGILLLGYPVAFSLAANGLLFFFVAVELSPYAPGTIALSWNLLVALPDRVFSIMSNEVLLAVPFFTFMGIVLQRSGMAEDLLETFGQFFGSVRGGVAYAVVFVGTLLAATTGVVAASVIAMGMISLPVMMRYGYDRRVASGTIMASGTLAQILPPSTILIVLADQLGTSVGDMYTVAFLPSLMLTLSFMLFILLVSIFRPSYVPALPPEALLYREPNGTRGVWQVLALFVVSGIIASLTVRASGMEKTIDVVIFTLCGLSIAALVIALMSRLLGRAALVAGGVLALGFAALAMTRDAGSLAATLAWAASAVCAYVALHGASARGARTRLISAIAERVAFVLVPPVLLIFLVLGTIFIGLATPVEAGAMGAVGSVVLALAKRLADRRPDRLNLAMMTQATYSTAKLCAFILFILIGARVFALTFFGINGHLWVEHLLTGLPGGQRGFMIFTVVVIFVLGCFLDFFEIAFIAIPLLLVPAITLGVDPLWLGLVIAITLQTSFLTPPLGFSLFFLRSIAPKAAYKDEISGKMIDGVSTRQIYLGGIPFVIIQLLLVIVVLFAPEIFMGVGGQAPVMDMEDAMRTLEGFTIDIDPTGGIAVPQIDLTFPSGN
ncbi:TRAP transporter large permease [Paracoccus denitrificans]|jgi:TRAP-type mannitol/chloroaromatic compound transport system permease large subunit|uniref:TRAP C4-dicarboxylate transport system permease DctM subunit n=1 Tax=Paracoccus denitrificans (strain Pd 1222) TaxID=318586 RepID=A1AYG1_PARDP|nr:TRAP transporter large permease subunit [Paracoccus denitrificans]ABL68305.1 TRAP C4-dicarboxylate transport system permease DctM subunit [Paracoccus denitrificans PD1222]MBB4627819.1 TRAP-type mannitol/chloroaromatic compound transport system permease large subunit [Paracoccus denitrificans]MCU7428645.1 TRAP transporter large permease subunit [Paracoccus denitrificans]QAR26395.1 TRAP transporter large permease subunit [Paracoccus denitrificans]UPV95323.1 TRAP transporter large permease sub